MIIPASETDGLGDIDLDKRVLWIGHYRCMKNAERRECEVLWKLFEDKEKFRKYIFIDAPYKIYGLDPRNYELAVEDHGKLDARQLESIREFEYRRIIYGDKQVAT